jgi:hypothetical protein
LEETSELISLPLTMSHKLATLDRLIQQVHAQATKDLAKSSHCSLHHAELLLAPILAPRGAAARPSWPHSPS